MSTSPSFIHRWLAICALLPALLPGPARAEDASRPIHQLRVYEIFDDTRGAFHDRFRDHAARIMAKYGFEIVAIWDSRGDDGRPQFVYLLEWPDERAMREGWEKFMADEEWARIKRVTAREHGRFVGDIDERVLSPADYSPRTSFLRD